MPQLLRFTQCQASDASRQTRRLSRSFTVTIENVAPPMDIKATAVRALMLYSLAEFQCGNATTIRVTANGTSFGIADDGRGHPTEDEQGRLDGFVLPVLFKHRAKWKQGRPQGTIYYIGVLPPFRGRGYAQALLEEATRVFIEAGCWRIFCDASSRNAPMLEAFRRVGYKERATWQRPLG